MDMQTCYLIRNICIAVFIFLALIETIYSIRIKIWKVLQKHYGIERNHEVKKFKQQMENSYSKPEVRVVREIEEEQTMLLDDFLQQKNEKSSKLTMKKNIIVTH